MDYHNIHMLLLLLLLTIITTLPLSQCQLASSGSNPWTCDERPYKCGTLSNISGPFWGDNRPPSCGGGDPFRLICNHDDHNHTTTTSIEIGSHNFTVKDINITAQTMRLVRTDLALNLCFPQYFEDTYLSSTLFWYPSSVYNLTVFYNCSSTSDTTITTTTTTRFGNFTCGNENALFCDGAQDDLLKTFSWLERCDQHLQVSVDTPYDYIRGRDFLKQAFRHGFSVNYIEPNTIDGRVLFSISKVIVIGKNWSLKVKLIVGVIAGATIAGVLICMAILCLRYKSATWPRHFRIPSKSNQNIESFLKNHEALAQKRYKFSEVKKMTNSFEVKLGEGGFGAVYKGELASNGSPVAVKILDASKGNGEDFINEVASISRTSHVNVVSLLGFCLEGNKKALIYEFMPNGSLDKFIYAKGLETTESLSWDNLWQIAIGIARGLEYLHRGCNTRILHFHIKPHNILLDENFCPKISDFGLAKLCPRKESIISMSNARGTIGYVAPEVWNRHFGGISHKSDVYSYGMMLLEMVGGRKNINAEVSHTSEVYFPDWIYNRLEQGEDLRPDGVMIATEENEIAKRMTIVGLWCVQTFPKDRPTMSGVVDMLEDKKNSLEMPPKPILSSPTRSVQESETSSLLFE